MLPATDDDTGTEEEEAEGEEQLSLLNSEANNDLPEDIKDGKYKYVSLCLCNSPT